MVIIIKLYKYFLERLSLVSNNVIHLAIKMILISHFTCRVIKIKQINQDIAFLHSCLTISANFLLYTLNLINLNIIEYSDVNLIFIICIYLD